jgi:DNA-binding GntR family transcriptional regulator
MPPTVVKEKPGKTAVAARKSAGEISSPDKVVEAINKGILTRRFGPGHRLVEADLANSLNVSRGTVREALKKLAAQGVVRISPHRGAAIRPLSRHEAEKLVEVLEVLCGLAARLAASNMGDGKARERFKTASDALTQTQVGTGSEQFLANRAHYYAVMLDIADNPELNRLMPVPQIHLFRSQFQSFLQPKDVADMQKEYGEISDAVLAGKDALAETRMRKHMRKTLDRLVAVSDDAFDQNY